MSDPAFLTQALDRLEEGVVALNMSLTPVAANRSGRALMGLTDDELPADLPLPELRSLARRAFVEKEETEALVRSPHHDRSLRVRAVPLDEPEGVLLFVRDVTDEHRTHQLRKQFVANASHELKTPVTSLQTLAEAIEEAADDPEDASRFARQIAQEAERLGSLIKDLLDLSRLEDPGSFVRSEIDLSSLVSGQVKAAEDKAADRSLHWEAQVEPGVGVRGDVSQLELLIRNLLDNAILYTHAEGRISIRLTADGSEAVLEVGDDGVGIPLQAQARVFERFYRVDDDRARAGGGTGLGLAIVKNAAEAHGGSVAVTSVLGEGSTFTVRLPLDR